VAQISICASATAVEIDQRSASDLGRRALGVFANEESDDLPLGRRHRQVRPVLPPSGIGRSATTSDRFGLLTP
jgi:hypothetical protein